MFARRIGLAVTRTGRRYLSEGVKPKSQGMINWNHPKLKNIGPFFYERYQKYAECDNFDRFWIRFKYGGMIGGTIGGMIVGMIGCMIGDIFVYEDLVDTIEDAFTGAFAGAITVGLTFGFYPIAIPLAGIIVVKNLFRRC